MKDAPETYVSMDGRVIEVPREVPARREGPRYEQTLRQKQLDRLQAGLHPLDASKLTTEPDAFCGNCEHLRVHRLARRYYKCFLFGDSHGPRTDVRLSWPGCSKWVAHSPHPDLSGRSAVMKERAEVTISAAAAQWLATGSKGLSSEALFSLTTGLDVRGEHSWSFHDWRFPLDPDDFQRCERMLRAVPDARENLAAARVTPQWTVLIEHWDGLVALLEEEVPGIFDGPQKYGTAPRGYKRMRELELESRRNSSSSGLQDGSQ